MLLAQYLYKKTHKGFIPLKCFCLNNERELDVMAIKEAAKIVYNTVVWTHDSARELSLLQKQRKSVISYKISTLR